MEPSLRGSLNGEPLKSEGDSPLWFESSGLGSRWSRIRQEWQDEASCHQLSKSKNRESFLEKQSEFLSNSLQKHKSDKSFLEDDDEEDIFRSDPGGECETASETLQLSKPKNKSKKHSSRVPKDTPTTSPKDLFLSTDDVSSVASTFSSSSSESETLSAPSAPSYALSQASDYSARKICDNDEVNVASVYCVECEEYFCSTCDQLLHKRKKTSAHRREPYLDFTPAPTPASSSSSSDSFHFFETPKKHKEEKLEDKSSSSSSSAWGAVSPPHAVSSPIDIPIKVLSPSLSISSSSSSTTSTSTSESGADPASSSRTYSTTNINVTNINTTNNINILVAPRTPSSGSSGVSGSSDSKGNDDDDEDFPRTRSEEPERVQKSPSVSRVKSEELPKYATPSYKGSFKAHRAADAPKSEKTPSSGSGGGFFARLFGETPSPSVNTTPDPSHGKMYISRKIIQDGVTVEQKIPLPTWEETRQYSLRLKQLLKTHQSNIEKLLAEQNKMTQEMETELEKWRKFAIEDLQTMGTAWHTARLEHMGGLLDMEWQISEILTSRINKVQVLLDNNKGFERLGRDLNKKGKLMSLSEIEQAEWFKSDQLDKCLVRCGEMAEKIRQLGFAYHGIQRKSLRAETFPERLKRTNELIAKGLQAQPLHRRPTDKYFHNYDPTPQASFRALMTDERTSEGQLIKRWRTLLSESGPENVSAEAVETFIQHLTLDILKRYGLSRDPELKIVFCLRLYVDRLIFPHIRDVMTCLETPREREGDRILIRKCEWARKLTEQQCGIEPDFTKPLSLDTKMLPKKLKATLPKWSKLAYGHSIELLSRLRNEYVPTDVFQRILECVRCIYEQATFYYYCHHPEKRPNSSPSSSRSRRESRSNSTTAPPPGSFSSPTPSLTPPPSASTLLATTTTTSTSVSVSVDSSPLPTVSVATTTTTTTTVVGSKTTPTPTPTPTPKSGLTLLLQQHRSPSASSKSGSTPASAISPSTKSSMVTPSSSPSSTTSVPTSTNVSIKDQLIISADSLFPIVLWVVIQSHLDNLHRCIGHLERFIPANQKNFGEMGMSLTLIEAAVSHITQMQPESFGLSPSVEQVDTKPRKSSGTKMDLATTQGVTPNSFTKTGSLPSISTPSTPKPKKIERNHVEKIVKNQRTINDTYSALL